MQEIVENVLRLLLELHAFVEIPQRIHYVEIIIFLAINNVIKLLHAETTNVLILVIQGNNCEM